MDSNDILDLEVPVSSIFLLRVLNMFFSEDSQTKWLKRTFLKLSLAHAQHQSLTHFSHPRYDSLPGMLSPT